MIAKDLLVMGSSRCLGKMWVGDLEVSNSAIFSAVTAQSLASTGTLNVTGATSLTTLGVSGAATFSTISATGNITTSGSLYVNSGNLYLNNKLAANADLSSNNVWLTINPTNAFSSGTYIQNIFKTDNLTATHADINDLSVKGVLQTDVFLKNTTQIAGGNLIVAPTFEGTSSTTIYCTGTETVENVDYVKFTISDNSISDITHGGATWYSGSKIKFNGTITVNVGDYPDEMTFTSAEGTLLANMNSTSHTLQIRVALGGASHYFQNSNTPLTFSQFSVMMYEVNTNNVFHKVGIFIRAYSENKASVIDVYGGTTDTPNVRLGLLNGMVDPETGQALTIDGTIVKGWGILTNSGYFKGKIVSSSGKIGNFTLSNHLMSGNWGHAGSVLVSAGYTPDNSQSRSIGGSPLSGNTWAFTAADTFGVTTDGSLYTNSGKIAGWNIDEKTMYCEDDDRVFMLRNSTVNIIDASNTTASGCTVQFVNSKLEVTITNTSNPSVTISVPKTGTIEWDNNITYEVYIGIDPSAGTVQQDIGWVPDDPTAMYLFPTYSEVATSRYVSRYNAYKYCFVIDDSSEPNDGYTHSHIRMEYIITFPSVSVGDVFTIDFTMLKNGNLFYNELPTNRFDRETIIGVSSEEGVIPFYVNNDGYLYSSYGNIGGFSIDENSISKGKNSLFDENDGVYIGADGISLGRNSPFEVRDDGYFTATSGKIGPWRINSEGLYGSKKINQTSNDITYYTILHTPSYTSAVYTVNAVNADCMITQKGIEFTPTSSSGVEIYIHVNASDLNVEDNILYSLRIHEEYSNALITTSNGGGIQGTIYCNDVGNEWDAYMYSGQLSTFFNEKFYDPAEISYIRLLIPSQYITANQTYIWNFVWWRWFWNGSYYDLLDDNITPVARQYLNNMPPNTSFGINTYNEFFNKYISPFYVTSLGYLYTNTGNIGGWEVNNNILYTKDNDKYTFIQSSNIKYSIIDQITTEDFIQDYINKDITRLKSTVNGNGTIKIQFQTSCSMEKIYIYIKDYNNYFTTTPIITWGSTMSGQGYSAIDNQSTQCVRNESGIYMCTIDLTTQSSVEYSKLFYINMPGMSLQSGNHYRFQFMIMNEDDDIFQFVSSSDFIPNQDYRFGIAKIENNTIVSYPFYVNTSGVVGVSNGVYVGANKTSNYTQSGVLLHPEGYVCLTNSTSVGSRGGIYFAYDNAATATAHIREISSGVIELKNELRAIGNIFVGSNKNSYYTQAGVGISGASGFITLTNPTTSSSRSGIYFAYGNATSPTAYIVESGSGVIEIKGSVGVVGAGARYLDVKNTSTNAAVRLYAEQGTNHGVWSSGYNTTVANFTTSNKWIIYRGSDGLIRVPRIYDTGYGLPIISMETLTQRVGAFFCNGANQLGIYATWLSTSGTFSYRYVNVTTSDPKLKENISPTKMDALAEINKIKLYEFDWKEDKSHWDVGYIAPELYELDPNLATKPHCDEAVWSVNDFYMSALQTKAIQELSAENTKLHKKIAQLEKRLSKLEGM